MIMRRPTPGLGQMGAIPLALIPIAAGAAGTAVLGYEFGLFDWIESKLRDVGLNDPVPPPAPAAPQTRAEMTSWTPELMEKRNVEAWKKWRVTAIPGPSADATPWLTYAALAAGGVMLLLLLKR